MTTFQKNWRLYLIEAWALGTFMIVAATAVTIIDHPAFLVRSVVPLPDVRRALVGVCMGLTAIGLIYSGWGKRSGAHLNPAVTLAQWHLNRISTTDALFYIGAQFLGGGLGIALFYSVFPDVMAHPAVNFVTTKPGPAGVWLALACEFSMAFGMLTMVLTLSNSRRLAPYTGYFVGAVVALYITIEAPFSGMSINPARTVSSALSSGQWSGWWVYFVGPISGMWLAAWLYRRNYRRKHGECRTMAIHLSGQQNGCPTYEVLWWSEDN